MAKFRPAALLRARSASSIRIPKASLQSARSYKSGTFSQHISPGSSTASKWEQVPSQFEGLFWVADDVEGSPQEIICFTVKADA